MAYAATRTVTGTADTPTTSDDGGLIQYTSASGKTITLSGTSWVAGRSAFAARISGGGTATFVAGSGVTVNGDTSIASGLTVVCQYTAANTWEIVGTDVVPVASGGTGATTAAAARRNLSALGPVFDVTAYGAVGNGSTNDTAAFNSARDAAVAAGGGIVYVPAGTYVVAGHVMANRVHYMGAHWRSSRLRLPASSTSPIFTTTNFASLFAAQTANSGTLGNFSITNLTFDGNRANAPSGGTGIEIYGCRYVLRDVVVRDCAGLGIVSAWGPGGVGTLDPSPFNGDAQDGMEAHYEHVVLVNNEDGNLDFQGPHDSILSRIIAIYNASAAGAPAFNVRTQGQAGGTHIESSHFWGEATYGLDMGASGVISATHVEGANDAQIRLRQARIIASGVKVYSPELYGSEVGFRVTSGCQQSVIQAHGWDLPGGLVDFDGDGGNNRFDLVAGPNVTAGTIVGTPAATTFINGRSAQNFFINANYTLTTSDAGRRIEVNNSGLVTITVPPSSTANIPPGTEIEIFSLSGPVQIDPGSGVFIRARTRRLHRLQVATLRRRSGANEDWDLTLSGPSSLGTARFANANTTQLLTDLHGWVEMNSASALTFTLLASADDSLSEGDWFRVACLGTGGVTIQAGAGGAIPGGSKVLTQGQVAHCLRRGAAGQWYVSVS